MNTLKPRVFRTILIAGALSIIIALALSVFSAAKVLSAPQASGITVPERIGFEGYLAESDGSPIADGTYSITFAVYDVPTGGTPLWSETHSSVEVFNGLYAVELGAVSFGANTFDGNRWIGVTVGSEAEITPRTKVSAVPFALNAHTLDGQTASDLAIPAGVVVMWSGAPGNVPEGWALCDGTSGTPDLSGRFIVGYDASDIDYDTIGETGGEETHILSIAEMPAHDHGGTTSTDGAHSHSIKYYTGSGSKSAFERRNTGSPGWLSGTTNTTGDHSHTIPSEGGGQAHENRPPYYTLAYIIKLP
jgi:microcystin-dependent protein